MPEKGGERGEHILKAPYFLIELLFFNDHGLTWVNNNPDFRY
jgi:hypothetical protein